MNHTKEKKEYDERHIKGAMFWNVDEHSDKDSPFPHMMSNSDYWTRMLWSFGIQNDDHIIVYDHSDVYSSCRLWFALKYFGHQKVSVLDGGMQKWLKENRPTSKEVNEDFGKFSKIEKLNPKSRYKVNENTGWINMNSLLGFAAQLDLDIIEFSNCMDRHMHYQKVINNESYAKQIGISATPTFLIFDDTQLIRIVGAQPLEKFQNALNQIG